MRLRDIKNILDKYYAENWEVRKFFYGDPFIDALKEFYDSVYGPKPDYYSDDADLLGVVSMDFSHKLDADLGKEDLFKLVVILLEASPELDTAPATDLQTLKTSLGNELIRTARSLQDSRIHTQHNFDRLFQHIDNIEAISNTLVILDIAAILDEDSFNTTLLIMNSNIPSALLKLFDSSIILVNLENFNSLCQHPEYAPGIAQAFINLHRANLLTANARAAICRFAIHATTFSNILIELNRINLLNQEYYEVILQLTEFKFVECFTEVLMFLQDHNLLTDSNRTMIGNAISYIEGLHRTLLQLVGNGTMFSQENFNLACNHVANINAVSLTIEQLNKTSLLKQGNFALAFNKVAFAQSIRCATSALHNAGALTPIYFEFICKKPRSALIKATKLQGAFFKNDATALSYQQVKEAALILRQGMEDTNTSLHLFFKIPAEILVLIAVHTRNPQDLEFESANEIAHKYFSRPH